MTLYGDGDLKMEYEWNLMDSFGKGNGKSLNQMEAGKIIDLLLRDPSRSNGTLDRCIWDPKLMSFP